MRKKKIIIAMALLLVLSLQSMIPAVASGIMPLYDNHYYCSRDFNINNDVGTVSINYEGVQDAFTYIDITVKIKKRTLGLFWTTVDIGYPDDEWTYTSTDINGYVQESFTIEDAGTYKAEFTIDFHGTSGRVDVIEAEIEHEYGG